MTTRIIFLANTKIRKDDVYHQELDSRKRSGTVGDGGEC
jgi:hypothetical protein